MEVGVVAGLGRGLLEERELVAGAGGICGLYPVSADRVKKGMMSRTRMVTVFPVGLVRCPLI